MLDSTVLQSICAETAESCAAIGLPVSRVVCRGEMPMKVYFLFSTIEEYAALMQEPEKKDRMMAIFIRLLTKHQQDSTEQLQLSFQFSIDL